MTDSMKRIGMEIFVPANQLRRICTSQGNHNTLDKEKKE